jgi:membrane fusion protein (multidrug efflux system)
MEPGDEQKLKQPGEPGERKQQEEPKRPSLLKRPRFIIIGSILLIVLTVVGLIWFQHSKSYESTNDAFIDTHTVPIAPQVAGQVLQVPVNDNQLVNAGDLLVQIDPSTLNARLAQANATLALNRSKLEVAKVDLTNAFSQLNSAHAVEAQAQAQAAAVEAQSRRAEADVARGRQLRTNNVISPEEFDHLLATARTATANFTAAKKQVAAQHSHLSQATNLVASARAQIVAAQAQIRQAQADLESARLDVGKTTIVAPMAGRVTKKAVERGAFVAIGQSMMAIVPDQLWVSANFKETQLRYMRPGQRVQITIDAFPKTNYAGHVDSIQAGSGSFFSLLPPENAVGNYVKVVQRVPVKIMFDSFDPVQLLGPGMSVVPSVHVRDFHWPIWTWILAFVLVAVLIVWWWTKRVAEA